MIELEVYKKSDFYEDYISSQKEYYERENADAYFAERLAEKDELIASLQDTNKILANNGVRLNKMLDEKDKEIALLKKRICNGDVSRLTWIDDCFDKDKEIAKLKAQSKMHEKEIEFMHSNCKWHAGDGCSRLHGELMAATSEIAELKQKLENVKTSMYADVVDANMENRRLRRALWIARAEWARSSALSYHLIESHSNKDVAATYKRKANKWEKAKDKCLKKAKEYK